MHASCFCAAANNVVKPLVFRYCFFFSLLLSLFSRRLPRLIFIRYFMPVTLYIQHKRNETCVIAHSLTLTMVGLYQQVICSMQQHLLLIQLAFLYCDISEFIAACMLTYFFLLVSSLRVSCSSGTDFQLNLLIIMIAMIEGRYWLYIFIM